MVTDFKSAIILLLVLYVNETSLCRNDICFTWKVTNGTLTLTCRVYNLYLSVFIDDPTGKPQADCLPPSQPNNCEPYYKNGTVVQYKSTNETVFRVNGNIDYSLNGNWTCRHGSRKDIDTVEVTVLRVKDENNKTATDELCQTDVYCIKSSLLWTMISYFSSVMICMVLISIKVQICSFRSMDDIVNKIIMRNKWIQADKIAFLSVYKKISFTLFTVMFLSFVVFLNLLQQKSCNLQYVSVGLGVMFAVINSVIFLNKDHDDSVSFDDTSEERENVLTFESVV